MSTDNCAIRLLVVWRLYFIRSCFSLFGVKKNWERSIECNRRKLNAQKMWMKSTRFAEVASYNWRQFSEVNFTNGLRSIYHEIIDFWKTRGSGSFEVSTRTMRRKHFCFLLWFILLISEMPVGRLGLFLPPSVSFSKSLITVYVLPPDARSQQNFSNLACWRY